MRPDDGLQLELGDPRAAYGLAAAGEPNPPMVEFRGHDGRCLAVPYARLLSIELRPDRGMALEFPEHQITVRGRNLRVLYEALARHRVTFVQEGDLDTVPEDDPFVDRIVIGPAEAELS
ncbi:MAG TPA: hypothetical protein VLA36_07935 [Longimicrobiales bacterium]|nr:hypothetical protein [Longimicrobiales bacterium]